jgi:hypothetical protein
MREIIGWEGGDSILAPGGSISNMYALMIARHKLFPQHKKYGMRAIKGQLIMYTSQHVSISGQYIHGLINYKDKKTKCRLYWCLIEFIDWGYSQSCWYFFDPASLTIAPLIFSLVHLHAPSPRPKSKVQYIQTVGWGEELSCVGDHILQEFTTLFLTRYRAYKIAFPPPNKKPRRGGAQKDKHLPQSPFTG